MENVTHPLLCTNIDFGDRASEVTDRCLSSVIREMDGYKIGIMGYTTPETPVRERGREVNERGREVNERRRLVNERGRPVRDSGRGDREGR